jgi:hypothetical protein
MTDDITPETPLTRSDVRATITPNTGPVKDPDNRRKWQDFINIALLVIAIWTMFFVFFPEFDLKNDLDGRIADFLTAVIVLFASAYGFTVTRPNIPKY